MKLIAVLLVAISMVGCASSRQSAMTYADVERIRVVDQQDCRDPDSIIAQLNKQLELKGYLGKNPEDLATDEDRRYNSRVKVIIWSLRIGCNNPNRYK